MFKKRTVKELKEMCRERGLPVSGKNAKLARRICKYQLMSDAERAKISCGEVLRGPLQEQ